MIQANLQVGKKHISIYLFYYCQIHVRMIETSQVPKVPTWVKRLKGRDAEKHEKHTQGPKVHIVYFT